MNTQTRGNPAIGSKGITLIEILLVIGLLVILLSFAMPSVSSAGSKAEMKAAFENLQYSLQAARDSARLTETVVEMHITAPGAEEPVSISFSSPGSKARDALQIPDYTIPADIKLVSDHMSYRFDERGLVENPGQILLVSQYDESLTSAVDVK